MHLIGLKNIRSNNLLIEKPQHSWGFSVVYKRFLFSFFDAFVFNIIRLTNVIHLK
jgi:hypothetical protein